AGMLYLFDPAAGGLYQACWFHRWTGLDCPGCGGLRALHALLHGRILDAWGSNPLVVALLPAAAWYGWQRWRNRHPTATPDSVRRETWMIWSGLVALVVFGVMRKLPFECFQWMASSL
ncbi:MAG TPA: DUF2752 domain-containing protein, partial [Verrucomicrobiota bacterium]|nr:DUF2752 domain-containing protein [Verrucomicrobiota bacterium]